jgi:hypothetical protein
MKLTTGALALFVVLAVGTVPAFADTISFTINLGNAAISGFTGPYAEVSVDLTSATTATLTFTSDTNSGNIYLLGDGGSVAVNVNALTWTLSAITGSNAGTGFTPGTWSDGGAGNEDGWGSFNQTINSFDGFTHSSDTISFTLTNTSGTWAGAANVLTPNASGYDVAAHIFVTADPADGSNGALATGFATNGPAVPEPGSLALFGSGLIGLAGMLRRKLQR